jgi:hypothetical protein
LRGHDTDSWRIDVHQGVITEIENEFVNSSLLRKLLNEVNRLNVLENINLANYIESKKAKSRLCVGYNVPGTRGG